MYAIVDIETTGGVASTSRITEIAILLHDGVKVTNTFETLINPECNIPNYITALTGINNKMVAKAPAFNEVAEQIMNLINDKIFVAHNVNFDYSFLKEEFSRINMSFNSKRLCTIRLSRKLLPGKTSYSLGKLCNQMEIDHLNRHRAMGDAKATAKLFDMLLATDKENFISYSLKKTSRELLLPPNLPREEFDNLPKSIGVYYFHDNKGTVIYTGKAVNIKQRIAGHFATGSETREKNNLINEIFHLSYEPCATEEEAHKLETYRIKKMWPKYNYAQKRQAVAYGIFNYEDQRGYQRFGINKIQKYHAPVLTFRTLSEARSFLTEKTEEHELCPKLSGLQLAPYECFDYTLNKCTGACTNKEEPETYNSKMLTAIQSLQEHKLINEYTHKPDTDSLLGYRQAWPRKQCSLFELF